MLRERFDAAGMTPSALRAAYDEQLQEAIAAVGVETMAAETGIDRAVLDALLDGESPDISLEEGAAILATDEALPDSDAIVAEARDILLIGMSTAVLDVEAIASGIDDAMEPKEIQQKVEGRYPMDLDEYAILHSYIESRKR